MSLTVIKNIICELTGYRPGTVDVSQGDRGSRAVSCRLMESGAPWMIPEGATARVAYTLPDGTEGLYDSRPDGTPMWEISGNIVTVELADQLMAQAGMVQMSILVMGPEGGQLATWPIRVMVTANKPARLTVPEEMPPYGAGFAGKIFFGGEDGTVTPLGIGDGVEIVRQEDGTFALVAYGGSGGGGGITEEKDPTVPAWAKQPQKPTYTAEEVGALPKDTKIPGKTSELTNDAGFVNKAVNDLVNYYNKVQLQELIAAIPRFRVTVVQQLPAAGEELVLYLVPFATAEGQYLEYIWVDGRWEIIGSQRVDLTGYATEVWVKDYVEEHSGQNVSLDTTLTQGGQAADAKAVGDALDELEEKIPTKPEDIGAQPKGDYVSPDDIPKVPGWAMQASKPAYTAPEVGADPTGTAASAVSAHNTNNAAHYDIRQELAAINARLTAFFDSDNQTLDELSEIVAYITSNKSLIDAITTSKVSVADIVNNLTTNVANKPLSAAQGVAIKTLIDNLSASLANYQPKGDYALVSAVPTKVSQLANDKGYLTEHQDISHLTPTVKAVTKAVYSELTPDDVAQLYADGIRMLIVEDGYTNLVPKSTDAAGNIYQGCGYLDGYRLTSSGGLTASDNCCVSGFMPYVHGSTYRIVGSCGNALSNAGQYIGLYDASYGLVKMEYASSVKATWEPRADGLWEMTIDTSKISSWSNAKYFRVSCALCVGADLKVTQNEPIGLEV